ncbi:unnamed protein product [Didymodactylos carnosus]|uniref:Gfo/Idh/MocA-like oxidoreductase N-terminal domain-containing protein n=1 Tax=Didymodactylos carnosus TaxID=1234261 RepID=A0A813X688_9BILA|nr:unnamed protein product [Didymodactylos carnosus]CAF0949642.1 unnamed protein product [Didymodactylos carnosus]CAF3654530.1 unnamed protein product [Didymodactylos carnosus]CAF3723985.1 unnamed protein product [Didymodactylos carnosus]
MPAPPPVLILGTLPIVEICVPLLRQFGFQVIHLWSPKRFTSLTTKLVQDQLKLDSYSCSTYSFEQIFDTSSQPLLVWICVEPDQHLSLISKIIEQKHHFVCMSPFTLDSRELSQIVQKSMFNKTVLSCLCYPLAFLPTYIKLKRMLQDEKENIGDLLLVDLRIKCSPLVPTSDSSYWLNDTMLGGVLTRFGSLSLALICYLFGSSHTILSVNNAQIKTYQQNSRIDDYCSFQLNYSSNLTVNITINSNAHCSYTQELIIYCSKASLIVQDYKLAIKRCDVNIEDPPRTIIDSYHSETGEKYLKQAKLYPELPMYYIQSLYYFFAYYSCTAQCYQQHKTSDVCQEIPVSQDLTGKPNPYHCYVFRSAIVLNDDETDDLVSPSTLDRLNHSSELLDLLKNRHLRSMIKNLDKSSNPSRDIQQAMMEPIFTQFVEQLLTIVENRQTNLH